MMNCKRMRRLVFLFADDELAPDVVIDYHDHVEHCPQCAAEAVRARRLLMVVRRTERRCAPKTLRARILARIPLRDLER